MKYLIIAIIILAIIIIAIYNSLIRKRNNVESAWANIDVQLQRRFDLIPNLVETVKAYAKHEKETLERVVELRNLFNKATSPKEIEKIDLEMNSALKKLFAVAENYPDLKANKNFLMLQESLEGTENRIAYSRNNYNHLVMIYNTAIQTFPGMWIAKPFGFKKKDFFEIEASEIREAVKVNFS
ncbi:MAG: LemA family protein [Clostridiales bacterium]|nr:LemA family protein [Clostridiales bacterium]